MKSFIKLLIVTLLWVVLSGDALAARIGVVKSRNLSSYNAVITAFSIAGHHEIVEYDMRNDVRRGKAVIQQLGREKIDLVLALGPLAAALAGEGIRETPILFCMVPNPESYGLNAPNISGISLTIPLKTQLGTLRIMADNVKRVGVLYNSGNSAEIVEQAGQAARSLGMELVSEEIKGSGDVSAALAKLNSRIDALWIIPDNAVLNRSAHNLMVDFTIRNRIPFFTLTPKLVKAGGLLSLSPDYASIGRQAALLAGKITEGKIKPSQIPISAPEGIKIAINLTTSKKIGVQCDIALEVFTYAARHGFPIEVYE